MANCKTCPACGATLDFGESCDCKGRGRRPEGVGQSVGTRAASRLSPEEARRQLAALRGRVTYRLVERPDYGPTIIEADVDGEPAYRYHAEYDPQRGVWHLKGARALSFEHRALYLKKWVYIDDVRDTRAETKQ